jgi:hypothetical protein
MDHRLIIVAKRHGADDLALISGPEVPNPEQERIFMQFRTNATRKHPDFSEVSLCRLSLERIERFSPEPKAAAVKQPKQSTKKLI